jgi:hypothetical protein
MKNSKQYNRFIQSGNAPVCVYGNVLVRNKLIRGKNNFLNRYWKIILRKASG